MTSRRTDAMAALQQYAPCRHREIYSGIAAIRRCAPATIERRRSHETIYVITTGEPSRSLLRASGAVLNTASKIGQYLTLLRLSDCDVRVIPMMNKDAG